jgi:hypothetical protein
MIEAKPENLIGYMRRWLVERFRLDTMAAPQHSSTANSTPLSSSDNFEIGSS